MRNVEVVGPSHIGYGTLLEAFKKNIGGRMNYKHFSHKYNEAEVGAILLSEYPVKTKLANVQLSLERWGLNKSKDFDVCLMQVDADGDPLPEGQCVVAVKKLTQEKMRRP